MIKNMTGTLRNRHNGATQVQRHETDPGEPPRPLRAPGMHRVPSGDLLSNAVEDLGGGGALCRRAEKSTHENLVCRTLYLRRSTHTLQYLPATYCVYGKEVYHMSIRGSERD